MKYGTFNLSLFLFFFVAAFLHAEDDQLFSHRNTFPKVNYALPGWVEIDSRSNSQGILPSSGVVAIEFPGSEYNVSRSGKSYFALSVGSDGRVILGRVAPGEELPLLGTGSGVYVIPTEKQLRPVSGSSSIALKWFFNNNYEGHYTVVQVGPFRVDGLASTYSYQVLAYPDGELQLFWWRHDAEYFWNSSPSFQPETSALGRSGLNNGFVTQWSNAHRVFLQRSINNLNPRNETIYSNESGLRPGWIAKSFDSAGVVFTEKAYSINVRFGTGNMPGGLFAYDNSREHPVAGAFEYVRLNLIPKSDSQPQVVSWYFSEPIPQTTDAYYPRIDPISIVDSVSQSCSSKMDPNLLLPCMYMRSWDTTMQQGKKPEWTPAPAIKFQSLANGTDREIDIQGIVYGLRQPRSVQFLPPESYQLDLRIGAGGYAAVEDMPHSNPYHVFSDQPIKARIVAKPGQKIARIAIDGVEVYNGTDFAWPIPSDPIRNLIKGGSGEISISGILAKSYIVEADFTQCTDRELALPASPAYVRTETFIDPPGSGQRNVETYTIKDGFSRTIQAQQKLENGNFYVQGTYLDAMGRTRYFPLPFAHSSSNFGYVDMSCFQCITISDAWYDGSDAVDRPDDLGFPYVEIEYLGGEGSGALQSSAGLGGASFALTDSWSKEWAIPVSDPEAFISAGDLTDGNIRSNYETRMGEAKNKGGLNYVLRISRDHEGRYRQSIRDGADNAFYTWAYDGVNVLYTAQEYDALNRPVKNYPAGHSYAGLASAQELDGAGRVRSETSPDRGKAESRYDQYGRIRFVRSARHLARGVGHFSAYEYDSLGRLTHTGEVISGHSFESPDSPLATGVLRLVTETVYGPIQNVQLIKPGFSLNAALSTEIAGQNVHPSDVGAIFSYDDEGNVVSLKAWSYDRLGRKKFQWIVYGAGNPPVRLEYSYNISGELTQSLFSDWNGTEWQEHSVRGREYDAQGRLARVLENNAPVAIYERSELGRLRSKTLYDRSVPVLTSRAEKDISGRPLSFAHKKNGALLYGQTASYDGNSGRLAQAAHSWQVGSQENVHSANYSYDALGRLSGANGDLGGQYGFDIPGRLNAKTEGGTTLAYGYQNSYRPAWIKTNGLDSASLWAYDASGNLNRDYRNMATYRTGARSLPVDVRGYESASSMPNTVAQVESGMGFAGEAYRVEMSYDESNQRILRKVTVATTGESRTDATIPGVAAYVRENDGDWQLARLELVENGYRPDGTGDALFAVKDIQGSIRGYVKKDGLISAYGYYPYGTVHEISGNDEADRSRWQGKEWDGEYEKYNFGSRFFDPYFGLWISPDPAGQFANPYAYGGDPLNYIDPDGEWIHIVVGAFVGGVAGSFQCGSVSHCTQAITAGAAVGALAAATGGLAAGAVTELGGGTMAAGIAGGTVGGAVGGAGNYGASAWMQGNSLSWGGFGKATGFGALGGAISAGVSEGLYALGGTAPNSWKSPTLYGSIGTINSAASGGISSGTLAWLKGEDLQSAIISGATWGAGSAMISSSLSFFNIPAPGTIDENGKWMTEEKALKYMQEKDNQGSVGAAVAYSPGGFLIAILSGNGPFSHIRGSGAFNEEKGIGEVLETNDRGAYIYKKSSDPNRMMYVTNRYSRGSGEIESVNLVVGKSLWQAGLCSGSIHKINSNYPGGSPNTLYHWNVTINPYRSIQPVWIW